MPLVASIDYPSKRIYLTADAMGATFDTMMVYEEVRALRRTTEAHRRYRPLIVGGGNIQKTATTYTQPYVQLLYGATLVPFDLAGKITLIRETFSDDGRSAAQCFDRSTVVANVDIDVQVPAVEVRTVSTGGGSSPADIWAHILEAGLSAEKIMRIIASQAAGNGAGLESASPQFIGLDGITPRITATYVNGTRTITSVNGDV